MIVTEKFVFIHLHKTGGQSLNDAITRAVPQHEVLGYHYPRSRVPEQYTDRPVVGVVRNPWDWYVSWYAFNQKPRMNNPLFHVASGGGSADFRTTISNLANLGDNTPNSAIRRDQLLQILPETLDNNRGSGLIKSDIEDLARSNDGYYSWLFKRMFGATIDDATRIARFENLQDDFVAILRQLDVTEADAILQDLMSREHKNASLHSHYSHYYDDTLCEQIAELDCFVVQQFDYAFEAAKPAGAWYEFPDDIYAQGPGDFQKLLGRAENFLPLGNNIDTTAIRAKIESIPDEKWHESEREQLFAVHQDTGSLQLVHFEDQKHDEPIFCELYDVFSDATQPVVDAIANYYRDNGFVVRMILAKLSASGKIPQHTDAGYSLLHCHRVHLPIITNSHVRFTVDGEEINMQVGELWEINNGKSHGVINGSDEDRIHLIVDWMPNLNNDAHAKVLVANALQGDGNDEANQRSLDAMIARANEQHKSGQLKRAEALYRQVLNFDEQHVIANNLLGLLCLQTGRAKDAIRYIGKALEVSAEDAQAHANIGIAYQHADKPEEAANHFRASLKLEPKNPRACNNLGGIYMSRGHFKEAATCFKQALAIQPGFAEVHYNLGNALLQLGEYEDAIQNLRHCVVLKPDFAAARDRLQQALAATGQTET